MTTFFSRLFLSTKSIYRTAFIASVMMLGLLFVIRIAIIFSYVPEITGVDNNFVNTVLRMLSGLSPYPNPEAYPYYGNIYSPLYFTICYWTGKLISVNADYPIQVYWLCRTVALACDILTVYFLYKTLKKSTTFATPVALFITAFFSTILCYLAYTFSRVDCLFLTLYAAIFYLLIRKNATNSLLHLLAISFLCTCSIFTKQNGCILPILISAWYFFKGDKKNILPFLLSFAVFFSVFFLIYTQWAGYNHLTDYTIRGLNNRIDIEWFYTYIFKPLANSILAIPLVMAVSISLFFLTGKGTTEKALSVVYIIQLVFSTGAAFKWGSSLGYYNESFFLAMLLIVKFLAEVKFRKQILVPAFWLTAPLVVIFWIHVSLQDYLFFIGQQGPKKEAYSQQETVKNYLLKHLNGQHVLNLYSPNRDFFKNFLYKNLAVPQFDTIDCCLLPDNSFDYTQLKNELLTGEIKYIIYEKDRPMKSIWGVSLERYKKDTSIFQYDIYKYQETIH